jgi:hypothetical protein
MNFPRLNFIVIFLFLNYVIRNRYNLYIKLIENSIEKLRNYFINITFLKYSRYLLNDCTFIYICRSFGDLILDNINKAKIRY